MKTPTKKTLYSLLANPNNSPEVVAKSKEKRKMTIQEIDLLIDRIGDDELE